MKLRKYFFFMAQLNLIEFVAILFQLIFNKASLLRNVRLRETIKFLEERYKDQSTISRNGQTSVLKKGIGNRERIIIVRRFTSDVMVYSQVILKEEFGVVVELFTRNNYKPQFCIDGGANIGLTTLYLKSHYPELAIIAVEPNEGNMAILKLNSDSNHLTNCHREQKGIWSTATRLNIEHSAEEEGMEWGFSLTAEKSGQGSITIEGTTVDELMHRYKWPRIDFLKLDIEGAESEIFKSPAYYSGFLKKVKVISLEVHSSKVEVEIEAILISFGFSIFKSGELMI